MKVMFFTWKTCVVFDESRVLYIEEMCVVFDESYVLYMEELCSI